MKKITGATALINLKPDLMHEAGIHTLRYGFRFPLSPDGGTPDGQFLQRMARARELQAQGFDLLGGTFGPGSYSYDPNAGATVWMPGVPEWIGPAGSDGYYAAIEEAGETLGRECAGFCTYWQVANEPNLEIFHGDMSQEQVVRFLVSLARGLKRGNPDARPGINLGALDEYARWLMPVLYVEGSPFDYIGIDGYMGCWQEGGPDDWIGYIDEVHAATGKPVIVNEWGYSTLQKGPNTDPECKRRYNQDVCRDKVWKNEWHGEHTPENQCDYITHCMEIFATHPAVIGELLFRWSDTETCWQCGDPLCPAECAWGIVDTNGNPKPGYYALKDAYRKYFGGIVGKGDII